MVSRRTTVKTVLDKAEVLEQINAGLKKQVSKPNLYAYVPHDKQFLFHKADQKLILYIGGNRSGKTTGGAVETIYRAMGRHPYKRVPSAPTRGRVHSVDFDYGVDQIILPEISRWIPPSFLLNGSWEDSYDREHRELSLANKSTIEFKSYAQDLPKFAGTSRNYNWYDEEPPKHIFNESQARLIDTDGDAFITMTPVDGMTWVYDDIYVKGINHEDEDIYIVEIDMEENPYLTKSARLRYLKSLDPEERKARERGEFVALGGKIFKSFNVTDHVIPYELPPKSWEWYASFDHGFNNPTAILWHAVSPNNQIITFSEHYKSEVTVEGHATAYHARNAGFERVPDFVVGDPAMRQRSGITGTSIVQEYADRGIYIGGESSDVDSGLNRMLQYLKEDPEIGIPRWRITENCTNLISEMKKYRWATYSSRKIQFEKNRQEKPHKKDDHAIDSTRYFFTLMPDLSIGLAALDTRDKRTVGTGGFGSVSKSYEAKAGRWDELLHEQLHAVRNNSNTKWNYDGPNETHWNSMEGTETYALEY